MYERPRNHQGIAYDYFTCTGRRLKRNTCQRSAILVHRVEDHITHAYQQQGVTSDEATRIKSVLGRVFDALAAASADERATLSAQKAKLEAEQVKLLQAHYADAIPIDLLKTEQDRIRASLHAINSRLDSLGTLYANAKIGLDAILDILTDLGDLYAKAEPAERRMLNRALFTKITIDDAEHVTTEPVQTIATILATDTSPNNARTLPHDEAGQGSNVTGYVDSIDHYGNTRQRVEQLISTWNQGSGGAAEFIGEPDDPLIDTSAEPRRRTRTPLTGEEVDAMRTARANGVSVNILAKQFGVHRGTVWAKTRQP